MFSRWKHSRRTERSSRRGPASRHARLRVEPLETRTLLSLSGLEQFWADPARAFAAPGPVGYTPAQVRQAYGFDRIRFAEGMVQGDGTGQTIALVTAYDHPSIAEDLRAFNQAFNLPEVPQFTRVNQFGGNQFSRFEPAWALETALDVQWAHAIAPGANILLVQANTARLSDLLTAVDYARQQPGVVAVSMSWGTGEFARQAQFNRYFTTPAGHVDGAGLPGGVTFVAASGDSGTPNWPATSPNVLAVGGSRLAITGTGTYAGEAGWRGSGGGLSKYEARPEYQGGASAARGRAVPDVSYGADPSAGFAVYATLPGMDQGWYQVGGTSAGAPQWAGLVAIAAQGRNLQGLPALDGTPGAVYSLPESAFNDILVGAGEGYDLVTGRGSPRADQVIAGLLGVNDSGAPFGPGAVGRAAEDQGDPPPPVDVGNLALILQTLSELPSNSGQTPVIPVTPGRLAELPPPVPPVVVPPPQPSFSVIHYKVGGDVVVTEPGLEEKPADKPLPQGGAAQAALAAPVEVTGAAQLGESAPPPPAPLLAAADNARGGAQAPEHAEAGPGMFRWAAAGALGLLLCGLWGSRVAQQRLRSRLAVRVERSPAHSGV